MMSKKRPHFHLSGKVTKDFYPTNPAIFDYVIIHKITNIMEYFCCIFLYRCMVVVVVKKIHVYIPPHLSAFICFKVP